MSIRDELVKLRPMKTCLVGRWLNNLDPADRAEWVDVMIENRRVYGAYADMHGLAVTRGLRAARKSFNEHVNGTCICE